MFLFYLIFIFIAYLHQISNHDYGFLHGASRTGLVLKLFHGHNFHLAALLEHAKELFLGFDLLLDCLVAQTNHVSDRTQSGETDPHSRRYSA